MNKVAFFDTKPYDKIYFDALKEQYGIEIEYFESRLSRRTAVMAKGSRAVVAFVNDIIDRAAIETLRGSGIELIALRCAGYNNVDLKAADGVMPVVRVPAYSPHAIAEHAMALLLTAVLGVPVLRDLMGLALPGMPGLATGVGLVALCPVWLEAVRQVQQRWRSAPTLRQNGG